MERYSKHLYQRLSKHFVPKLFFLNNWLSYSPNANQVPPKRHTEWKTKRELTRRNSDTRFPLRGVITLHQKANFKNDKMEKLNFFED